MIPGGVCVCAYARVLGGSSKASLTVRFPSLPDPITLKTWTISIQMLCSRASFLPESSTLSVNKSHLCLA